MADERYSIVVGSVNGRLSDVFSKLATLHSKQNFAFAILVGNLFANPEDAAAESANDELTKLLNGEIEVVLPTYFTIGTWNLPESVTSRLESGDGELCPNLTFLGRRASLKTSEGFRIVSIGGKYDAAHEPDESMNAYQASYRDSDIEAFAKDLTNADILVTSEWPASVRVGAKASYLGRSMAGISGIADLCTTVKPRYHFSTSEAYYEREPFFHNGERPYPVTRFLSLAPFGNPEKAKAMYAFSLEPMLSPPQALPQGCTASPFNGNKKRKLDSQQESYNNFRYANGNGNLQPDFHHGRRNKRQRYQPPPTPDQCFFCISNTACETHMIGAIGKDCYLAVAKGPLSTRTTFPTLGFPAHMLIVPLQHSPTIASIPDEARDTTTKEAQRFRSAMQDMLVSKSKDSEDRSQLGAVTWEISRSAGVHLHWQFLPVPVDLINRGLVEAAFDVEAENLSYPKFAKTASDIAQAEKGDYFKAMIWSETWGKEIVLPFDGSFRFNLQFGRNVLAKLLGLEGRMDWKACAQDKPEEEADAQAFKDAFKEFDFSYDEE